MKIKNLLKKEINKSYFSQYVQNSIINNEEHPFFLYGNFFIDGLFFLPIEHNTLTTSLDLFSFLHKIKYEKYFTSDYLNLLKNHTKNIQVLRNRLSNRHKGEEKLIEQRMKKFNEEISHWNEYDYVVVNDDLETCYNKILNTIMSEIKGIRQTQNLDQIAKMVEKLTK